jgi:hypothetical protein
MIAAWDIIGKCFRPEKRSFSVPTRDMGLLVLQLVFEARLIALSICAPVPVAPFTYPGALAKMR